MFVGFPCGSDGKESYTVVGADWSLSLRRCPGEGNSKNVQG